MTLDTFGMLIAGAHVMSAVPLGMGWLISRRLGSHRASVRHHVWVVALIVALLAPIARSTGVRIEVPLLSPPQTIDNAGDPLATSSTDLGAGEAVPASRSQSTTRSVPLGRALAWIWLGGFVLLVSLRFVRRARLARLVGNASVVVARAGDIRTHDRVLVPMLAGLHRPTILLPSSAGEWPPDERDAVVVHERVHLARGDHYIALLCDVATAMYWLNPLMWAATAAIEIEREQACDEEVVRAGVKRSVYAAALLRVADTLPSRRSLVDIPTMAGGALDARIRFILDGAGGKSGHVPWSWPLTIAIVLPCTVLFGGVSLVARSKASQPAPEMADVAKQRPAATASSSTLFGLVFDPLGRIVVDQQLVLTNVSTGERHQGGTDSVGQFRFAALDAGEYRLEAERPGFLGRSQLRLHAGETQQSDLRLELRSIEETVSVDPGDLALTTMPGVARDLQSRYVQSVQCGDFSTGGCLEPPRRISDVVPAYPQRRLGESATVLLEGRIGTDGSIKGLRLHSPDSDFAAAAFEAINQWRFIPTRVNGITVETGMNITVKFGR